MEQKEPRRDSVWITAASYPKMTWKNGLGVTTQIAIHPPQATMADFEWRISSAEVKGSNPFSRFDGYNRVLVILEANADCILTHIPPPAPNRPLVPLSLLEPYHFSGSIDTHCTVKPHTTEECLIKQLNECARGYFAATVYRCALQDFNVIYKAHLRSIVTVRRIVPGETSVLTPNQSASAYLLFLASGSLTVNGMETKPFSSILGTAPQYLCNGGGVVLEVNIIDG